jgi:exopolysaccharide biosynthesis predicted pyruvyltransferase EpsI
MTKILLLNDTSNYHYGCKQCVNVIKRHYESTTSVCTDEKFDISKIKYFDQVILNGEGTLHDNQPNANKFLEYLKEAQKLQKKTLLINTVWQNMSIKWKETLKKCSVIEVREICSQKEIYKQCNIKPHIVLDASIHSNVNFIKKNTQDICLGGSFYGPISIDWDNYTEVNIFNMPWETLVNNIKSSRLLITGRHHEMYAALQARIPVIIIPGNTWKNEGFFYTIGCPELIMQPTKKNIRETLDGKYDSLWQKVWKYLDNYYYKYLER